MFRCRLGQGAPAPAPAFWFCFNPCDEKYLSRKPRAVDKKVMGQTKQIYKKSIYGRFVSLKRKKNFPQKPSFGEHSIIIIKEKGLFGSVICMRRAPGARIYGAQAWFCFFFHRG